MIRPSLLELATSRIMTDYDELELWRIMTNYDGLESNQSIEKPSPLLDLTLSSSIKFSTDTKLDHNHTKI
jgi:hypothetical protein